jgi:hypothetical protein
VRRYLRFAVPQNAGAIRTVRLRHHGFFSLVVEFDEDRRAARVRGERYRAVEGGQAVLSPWSGSCTDYRDFSGLQMPSQVEVSWDLNEGQFSYARFRLTEVEYKP